ncbi:MAG: polysaccharide biosynthesis tyrosine autokinase [Aeromicrobium sp.]
MTQPPERYPDHEPDAEWSREPPSARRRFEGDAVREMVSVLRRGWWVVLLIGAICGALAYGYNAQVTPTYAATATLYVTSSGTEDDSSVSAYQGLLASQQRVISYTRLVDSDAVARRAIDEGGLGLDVEQVRDRIAATSTPNSVLLNITAEDEDEEVAQRLANAVAEAMTSYVSELETPTAGAQPMAKLTVVTPATVPDDPVRPQTVRNVALAVIAGLLAGMIGVLARARFSTRIRGEADIAQVTDVPVLASIPTDARLRHQELVDYRSGSSPAAEAFRTLRTNLSFTGVDREASIFLVTSPVAGEGKTTTAINLAAAIAETGKTVVLVDADLRRPQVDRRTGRTGAIGMTTWLRDDSELMTLLQPTDIDHLVILAAGPQPPNPAELLGSAKTGAGLKQLALSFDYVVVDAPPALPVTDATVLAQWVDGVIMVVRSRRTRLRELGAAIDQVRGRSRSSRVAPVPVVGIVVSDSRSKESVYGYPAARESRRRGPIFTRSSATVIEDVLTPDHPDA